MLHADKLIARGRGLAPALVRRAPTIEGDWAMRRQGRFEATDSSGRPLGVTLPAGTVLRGGDVLVADDGSLVAVKAAAQPVMVVRPCAAHGSPSDLLRAAYRLGQRQVPLDLQADRLLLEPDPDLASLLRGMHLLVSDEQAAFEPEGDAEAAHDGAHTHTHGHGHGHEHVHHHHSGGHGQDLAQGHDAHDH